MQKRLTVPESLIGVVIVEYVGRKTLSGLVPVGPYGKVCAAVNCAEPCGFGSETTYVGVSASLKSRTVSVILDIWIIAVRVEPIG